MDVEKVVQNCRAAFDAGNIVVINLPPNTEGKLVADDIAHLMEISGALGCRRV